MSEYRYWRRRVVDRVSEQLRGDSLRQLDQELRGVRSLSEDERAALWLLAWGEHHRDRPASEPSGREPKDDEESIRAHLPGSREGDVTDALKVAQIETDMDVAMLGEVRDGHEVVRALAGDGRSFGLSLGSSLPIEDTYCHRLLTGRLSNLVPDAQANEQVRNLEITHAARVGAYIGVPLTGRDARLYVLCCLAHEQRPGLAERDVLFLRDLGEEVLAALD
jgi:GAF domain-containing protein